MISKQQLTELAKKSDLSLYQQEKDYALKLFLFNYYRQFGNAIFKGGTCIKYLYGLNRFSEDLDFNIKNPEKFQKQVKQVLKQIDLIGIKTTIKKEETFKEAYTIEISFQGPLFNGEKISLNKFRIDAGYRIGTITEPEWNLISSAYPETPKNFLVKTMSEEEMFVEKVLAMFERHKGRDLFDVWFMLKKGTKLDRGLLAEKSKKFGENISVDFDNIVSKKEYERDLSKLTKKVVSYEQIVKDLEKNLK